VKGGADLLSGSPASPEPDAGKAANGCTLRLDVKKLACARNDCTIFTNLNVSLEAGQILQVEGANGSGKTTFLRALCGLTPSSGGEILWCGERLADVYPEFLAELAYVGHAAAVKDDLTPLENLRLTAAMATARPGVAPEDALERLGIPPEREDVPCRQLSAGQRRRVALGRLLMADARLWVLDEPFTALDRSGRAVVEELLAEHAGRGGMAAFTTHQTMRLEGCTVSSLRLS